MCLIQRWCFNSADARDGIFQLRGSIPCLLMHWLLKSPEHQQPWYWLCRTDNVYCCRLISSTWVQPNPRYNPKNMWIYLLNFWNSPDSLRVHCLFCFLNFDLIPCTYYYTPCRKKINSFHYFVFAICRVGLSMLRIWKRSSWTVKSRSSPSWKKERVSL